MLPASDLTEILANLAALNLQPNTAAAVIGAVLVPLLRSPELEKRAGRGGPKPRRAPRRKRKKSAEGKSKRRVTTPRARDARERAIAALKANPDATLTTVAKTAGVSRGTAVNARDDMAAESRKAARKEARKSRGAPSTAASATAPPKATERRQRAQRFLKDALAHGARPVSDLEAVAEKAHIDPHALGQARAELGVVTSRGGNAGGVQAVTWSLPG